jgi:hypothetical protein
MITYYARVIAEVDQKPAWNTLEVGVFKNDGKGEEQVGSYSRNYSSLYSTFFHFRKDEKDFALYSPDYTVTRILELPSCKDIGGEEPSSNGFCPVEYFVPSYLERESHNLNDSVHRYRVNEPSPEHLLSEPVKWYPLDEKTGKRNVVEKPSYPITPILFHPYGFVAGCIWGDDSSWKIQFLGLTQADKGIIKRDERFGYIELARELSLKKAVRMFTPDYRAGGSEQRRVTFSIDQRFDLETGKLIDEDPFA